MAPPHPGPADAGADGAAAAALPAAATPRQGRLHQGHRCERQKFEKRMKLEIIAIALFVSPCKINLASLFVLLSDLFSLEVSFFDIFCRFYRR